MNSIQPGRPLIFGEVLFDVYPDGTEIPGGAPFNVALHLQAFGANPLFISRIGDDERGQRILGIMESWGLDNSCVQRDRTRPTGQVSVTIDNNEPCFHIEPVAAYDNIKLNSVTLSESIGLLYHGTLALRSSVSQKSLLSLLDRFEVPVFVDINLRSPWYDDSLVVQCNQRADWLKLNRDELSYTVGRALRSDEELYRAIREVKSRFSLEVVIVTLGKLGAVSLTGEKAVVFSNAEEIADINDTVGAGDAFSAVTILGLLHGWDFDLTVSRAVTFSAEICRLRGAVPSNRSLHEMMKREWGIIRE